MKLNKKFTYIPFTLNIIYMKNFNSKLLLLPLVTAFLLSCDNQVQVEKSTPIKAKYAIQEKTWLEDGMMHFSSTDGFYAEVNIVGTNKLSDDQKSRHAKFTSLSEVLHEALAKSKGANPEATLRDLKNEYGNELKIVVKNNTLELDQFNTAIAQVVNPQGRVMIAQRLFEFDLNKINYTEQPYSKLAIGQKLESIAVVKRGNSESSSPNAKVRPFYGSGTGYYSSAPGSYLRATIGDYVYNMPYYQPVDPNLRGSYDDCPKCDDYTYNPVYQTEYRGTVQRVSITAYVESRSSSDNAFFDGGQGTSSNFYYSWSFNINASETKNYYNQCYQNGQETSYVTTTDVGNRSRDGYYNNYDDYRRAEYNFTLYDAPVNADISNFQASFRKEIGNGIGGAIATVTW